MGYKHIEESDILSEFKGKRMNMERVSELCWNNLESSDYPGCMEYVCSNDEYMDNEELVERLRISDTLVDKWRDDGIDYWIN